MSSPPNSAVASEDENLGGNKHGTPSKPSRVRNPFERAILHKFNGPICSPGMCNIYKNVGDGTFRWEIEQHATLKPVEIIACSSQFEPSPDPQFDRLHEELTQQYFAREVVVPSPFVEMPKRPAPLIRTSDSDMDTSCNKIVKDSSAQTILTLPPRLPAELEQMLEKYCTYIQDESYDSDVSWLRRRLEFEQPSDSDHTDTDTPSPHHQHQYTPHTPVTFSPDMVHNAPAKGMKRTFRSPLANSPKKTTFHNKLLESVDMGPALSPIGSGTPSTPATPAIPVSPIPKISDHEKAYGGWQSSPAHRGLARSVSLRRSRSPQHAHRRVARSGRRSSSLSSLADARSRSVQRLDFSLDMSVDRPLSPASPGLSWQPEHTKDTADRRPDFTIDETPIKSKRHAPSTHCISYIRHAASAADMSLDDSGDDPLGLAHQHERFTTLHVNTTNASPPGGDTTQYYSSAIRRSELTAHHTQRHTTTDASKLHVRSAKPCGDNDCSSKPESGRWMRVDSGFRDDTSCDSALDEFLAQHGTHNALSLSDMFAMEMSTRCNFSSTPSKHKPAPV